jgi:hypothetical protein
MAFIRKRISPSRRQTPSYQVIETYREEGKVKQRVLANLGCNPTPEKALAEFRSKLRDTRLVIEELQMKRTSAARGQVVDQNFERWSRTYARQKDTVDKLEALVQSGRKLSAQDGNPSDSGNFLDWVLERNSKGWI